MACSIFSCPQIPRWTPSVAPEQVKQSPLVFCSSAAKFGCCTKDGDGELYRMFLQYKEHSGSELYVVLFSAGGLLVVLYVLWKMFGDDGGAPCCRISNTCCNRFTGRGSEATQQ